MFLIVVISFSLLTIVSCGATFSTITVYFLGGRSVHDDLVDEWLITTQIEQRLIEINCQSLSSWEELLASLSHKVANNLSASIVDAGTIASICEEVELTLVLRFPEILLGRSDLSNDQLSGKLQTLLSSFLQPGSKATVLIISRHSAPELRKTIGIL